MNLINDWKQITKKAYSFRFAISAGLLSSVATIMAVMVEPNSGPMFLGAFILVSIASSVAGFASAVSRIVAQPKMYAPESTEANAAMLRTDEK